MGVGGQNRGLKAGPEERQGLPEASQRGNRRQDIFGPLKSDQTAKND
jgi:hypothetical protein